MTTPNKITSITTQERLTQPGGLASPKNPNLHYFENTFGTAALLPTKLPPEAVIVAPINSELHKAHPQNTITYDSLQIIPGAQTPVNELQIARTLATTLEQTEPDAVPRHMAHHLLAVLMIDDAQLSLGEQIKAAKDYLQETLLTKGFDAKNTPEYQQAIEYLEGLTPGTVSLEAIANRVSSHMQDLEAVTSRNITEAVRDLTARAAVVLPPNQPQIAVATENYVPSAIRVTQTSPINAAYGYAREVEVLLSAKVEATIPEISIAPQEAVRKADVPVILAVAASVEETKPRAGDRRIEINPDALAEEMKKLASQEIPAENEVQKEVNGTAFATTIKVSGIYIDVAGIFAKNPKATPEQFQKFLEESYAEAEKKAKFTLTQDAIHITGAALEVFQEKVKRAKLENGLSVAFYFNIGKIDYVGGIGRGAQVHQIDLRSGRSITQVPGFVDNGTPGSSVILPIPSNAHTSYLIGAANWLPENGLVFPAVRDRNLGILHPDKNTPSAVLYLPPEELRRAASGIRKARLLVRQAAEKAVAALDNALLFVVDKDNPTEYNTHALEWIQEITKRLTSIEILGHKINISSLTKGLPGVGLLLLIGEKAKIADDKFIATIKGIDVSDIEKFRAKVKAGDDWFKQADLPVWVDEAFEKIIEFIKIRQGIIVPPGRSATDETPTQPSLRLRNQVMILKRHHKEEVAQPNGEQAVKVETRYTERNGSFMVERVDKENGLHLVIMGAPQPIRQGDQTSATYYKQLFENTPVYNLPAEDIAAWPEDYLQSLLEEAQAQAAIGVGKRAPPMNLAIMLKSGDRTIVARSGLTSSIYLVGNNDEEPITYPVRGKSVELGLPAEIESPNWLMANVSDIVADGNNIIILSANGVTRNLGPMQDIPEKLQIREALRDQRIDILSDLRSPTPQAFAVAYIPETATDDVVRVQLRSGRTRIQKVDRRVSEI